MLFLLYRSTPARHTNAIQLLLFKKNKAKLPKENYRLATDTREINSRDERRDEDMSKKKKKKIARDCLPFKRKMKLIYIETVD